MKLLPLALLLPLTLAPLSVRAQQINTYGVCKQYQEVYTPGYTDQYGNYYSGIVTTQAYNVPCNGNVVVNPQPYYNNGGGYYRQRVCNPNNAAYGAAMGAGLASALSGGTGWKYNSSWSNNYSRNGSSGSYSNSYRGYRSNGWTLFGAGLGALMYSC